jgi:hypothetical protein
VSFVFLAKPKAREMICVKEGTTTTTTTRRKKKFQPTRDTEPRKKIEKKINRKRWKCLGNQLYLLEGILFRLFPLVQF